MAPSGSEWCQVEFERLNYTERMLFSDQCCCLVEYFCVETLPSDTFSLGVTTSAQIPSYRFQ